MVIDFATPRFTTPRHSMSAREQVTSNLMCNYRLYATILPQQKLNKTKLMMFKTETLGSIS